MAIKICREFWFVHEIDFDFQGENEKTQKFEL
jgi:hypothetical protein